MLSGVLPSLIVLGLAGLAALHLVQSRWSPPEYREQRDAAARVLALSVGIQGVHFLEELTTGFHDRLGALLGLPSIPVGLFVAFNVTWLGVWIASVWRIRSARADAFFAAWFLAIAGVANGVLHPLLALAAAEYFPGVVTSSFISIACVWLFIQLHRATRTRRSSQRTHATPTSGMDR